MGGILPGSIGIRIPIPAPVSVWYRQHVDVRGGPFAAGAIKLIRTDLYAGIGIAVIADFYHEYILLSGTGFG